MKVKGIIDYFIPQKYADDPEHYRKSRFVVWFAVIATTIGIFFTMLLSTLDTLDYQSAIVGFALPVLMIFALFHFRAKGSFIFTTHFVCGFFTVGAGILPNGTGGLLSPDMPTIYILPLFALFMGNFRIGLFYACAATVILLTYYFTNFAHAQINAEQIDKLPPEYFAFNLVLNLFVILFLVFRNEKLRLKIVDELRETNVIISHKSQEITDSINYAKKIQAAILPEADSFNKHFPHSFVVYMPKDIVSGDFFWTAETGGHRFLAVADCTGHGVPGALMSVVGVHQLNDIVLEKGISDTAEILQQLDRNINKILKQQQSDISDGMDIAILKLGTGNVIEFAGANRPLYHVRDGKLNVIKATKSPIGGFEVGRVKDFKSAGIHVLSGDMVYLTSDGYADQFGGEKNKKLTTRKFKSMLESISATPIDGQQQHLIQSFNTFKGNYEQTDDVLVIGLKF